VVLLVSLYGVTIDCVRIGNCIYLTLLHKGCGKITPFFVRIVPYEKGG
jgi:hypothetical protein